MFIFLKFILCLDNRIKHQKKEAEKQDNRFSSAKNKKQTQNSASVFLSLVRGQICLIIKIFLDHEKENQKMKSKNCKKNPHWFVFRLYHRWMFEIEMLLLPVLDNELLSTVSVHIVIKTQHQLDNLWTPPPLAPPSAEC